MRVRLYRPAQQRRARWLLAIAILLPAAGLFQASGINPLSVFFASLCIVASLWLAIDTARPTATVTRHGILIRGPLGRVPDAVSWSEVVRVEEEPGLIRIGTRGKVEYQVLANSRVARFISRRTEHSVTSRL